MFSTTAGGCSPLWRALKIVWVPRGGGSTEQADRVPIPMALPVTVKIFSEPEFLPLSTGATMTCKEAMNLKAEL